MSEKEMYCLGYEHLKCHNCKHWQKWKDINQLNQEDFLDAKGTMIRISDDECRLLGLKYFEPVNDVLTSKIAISALDSGDEDTIRKTFDLLGVGACEVCGFVKNHCRCQHPLR
jgi:hypothetical protein